MTNETIFIDAENGGISVYIGVGNKVGFAKTPKMLAYILDTKKIFAAGWSLGGTASLFNAWTPLQNEIHNEDSNYAGYLMWYPGCLALPDLNRWDHDHLQIYIGRQITGLLRRHALIW